MHFKNPLISLICYLCQKSIEMIRFFENYNLKAYNTFGVDVICRYFFEFTEPEDLDVFVQSNESWKELPLLVLGGGSNTLFMKDFDGLILHPNLPGIVRVQEDRQNVWYEVGAGVEWDEFVNYAVNSQVGGIENLSIIPGLTGAAPIQNIGAYGQEVSETIALVKGYDLQQKMPVEFSTAACEFSYRDSLFKRELKNRVVITSVIFKLEKFPEFNLKYGHVEEKVTALGEVNLQNIRKAVIDIRSSKLPDVKDLGNAGSFFKNPVAPKDTVNKIQQIYPDAPVYPVDDEKAKLAAGWLIEKTGLKGYRSGNVGVHEKQSLVLVNYGGATGTEIYEFSEMVKLEVLKKFDVELEREVNVIA
jgi:UDP-N-acetylmuramate dehydrogenase